jgi:hypothetical protein
MRTTSQALQKLQDKTPGTLGMRPHSGVAGLPEEVFLEEGNTLGDDWWTVQKEYNWEIKKWLEN